MGKEIGVISTIMIIGKIRIERSVRFKLDTRLLSETLNPKIAADTPERNRETNVNNWIANLTISTWQFLRSRIS